MFFVPHKFYNEFLVFLLFLMNILFCAKQFQDFNFAEPSFWMNNIITVHEELIELFLRFIDWE